MTATLQSIKAGRAQAEARLAALRAQRGAALADGSEAQDDSEIERLHRLAAALDDAEGAIVARERETTRETITATRERLKAELFRLEEKRLAAVSDAEKRARGLVAAISEILETSAEMRSTCLRGKFPLPIQIGEPSIVSRLGQHLSAVLRTIPGHPARFGGVAFTSSPKTAAADWVEDEQRAVADALKFSTENYEENK